MEDNKWFRKNEQGKQCLDHWRWGECYSLYGIIRRSFIKKRHLGMYLKEKRELAEQTSGVFKVCVAGLRNERRVIGDEVKWIMESHIIQGLVEHLNNYGFWVRWGTLGDFEQRNGGIWCMCWMGAVPEKRLFSCRSELVVSWMSVTVKVMTSRWSWEWSCLNFPTVLDGIWKTGVKDNSSSIKIIKAVIESVWEGGI